MTFTKKDMVHGNRPRSGFTLLELMIFVGLMVLIITSMTQAGSSASRLFDTSVSRVRLEQNLRQAFERLRQELERTSKDSLGGGTEQPGFGNTLTFDSLESTDRARGSIEWRTWRVELRMEDGELDDGVDQDGDGVIDEGQLMLVRDPDTPEEMEILLCRRVRKNFVGEIVNGVDDNGNGMIDETGFAMYVDGDSLHLFLALEGVDAEGRVIERSMSTAVRMRN